MDTSGLEGIVGKGNVISSKVGMEPFSMDKSYFKGEMPLAVVRPESPKQVSAILGFCSKRRINVVVHGSGSALTGSSVPTKSTVVIDMSHLKRILEVHLEDGYVVVEPGVIIGKLNERLSKSNYFYPPDPASSGFASIGGSISTNAGGLRAVMYGSTKEWILGLEVVLPTGEIVQTGGRTIKRSVGYDFTSLIVGSEGTLGVVTKAILRIIPKPESVGRVVAYYRRMDDAVLGISRLKRAGMPLLGAEFLDKSSMDLIRRYRNFGFPEDTGCMLMVDIPTAKESLDRLMNRASSLLAKSGPLRIEKSKSKKEMERLYLARRSLYEVAREFAEETHRSIFISDVIVPTSQLSAAVRSINSEISKCGFETELFSHIGDGNIHVNVIAKISEIKKVEALLERFAEIAIHHQGSVSGEHGIGIEKKALLIEELKARKSLALLGKMRGVKRVFDPKGILNKGKVFD